MKIWACNGSEVVLSQEYERQTITNNEIEEIINREWPDPIVHTWEKNLNTMTCCSPEAKDWQCGSFGSKGLYCHRIKDHSGQCTDLLVGEDRAEIQRQLVIAAKNEVQSILCGPGVVLPKTKLNTRRHTGRFSTRKLRKILKEDLI